MKKLRWNFQQEGDKEWGDRLYEIECDCGCAILVKTQRDESPEYHTTVEVRCEGCGKFVPFELPVN